MPTPRRTEPLKLLVYSDNARTREKVRSALGKRVHPDLPELSYLDVATAPVVVSTIDQGGIDLAILDGEATPAGGLGVCRTIKQEVFQAPPILVLIARPQDQWLASWSRAEGVVSHPIDPITTAAAAAELLRSQVAGGVRP